MDGTEFGAVIKHKVQVGYHGSAHQKTDGCHFHDVVLLDGKLVHGSEEQDRVVSWRLREFGGSRRGWGGRGIWWSINVVQRHVRVADMICQGHIQVVDMICWRHIQVADVICQGHFQVADVICQGHVQVADKICRSAAGRASLL